MRRAYFISHPDVVLDPKIPVPRWPLSTRGLERMRRLLEKEWVHDLGCVCSSTEQKAVDGARVLSSALEIRHLQHEELGENDRSATGFLAGQEFQDTVAAFFGRPHESIRGWETAVDAQTRIIRAVETACADSATRQRDLAIVSHGGVGTLLLCHLLKHPISRELEQPAAAAGSPPGTGGGHYFLFCVGEVGEEGQPWRLQHGWRPIDS